MSSYTCPLCRLQYSDRPLLELHIREDHAQREDKAAAPAPPEAAAPGGPAGLHSWAAAARRALSRLTRAGRETADRPRKAA